MTSLRLRIPPRTRDLGGGATVGRLLPYARLRAVGPFVFLDHIGPADVAPGDGTSVRPHPHIGLATVTWLFDGDLMHADSLGTHQRIRPGELNWMSAGRGIVHSERTPPDTRAAGHRMHGAQAWVALPIPAEESEPTFQHVSAADLPTFTTDDAQITVIAGTVEGHTSPVVTASPLVYAEVRLGDGGRWAPSWSADWEIGVFVVEGTLRIGDDRVEGPELAVLEAATGATLTAEGEVRLMLLGGPPLDGPRHIWWNFVHSDAARISAAADDWQHDRFPKVPGETERIPLPEIALPPR